MGVLDMEGPETFGVPSDPGQISSLGVSMGFLTSLSSHNPPIRPRTRPYLSTGVMVS